MRIAADTHVHLYPSYDLRVALRQAFHHLGAFRPDVKILMLAERADCHAFRTLREGDVKIPDYEIKPAAEPEAVVVSSKVGDRLFIMAGRQIVTAERIEILALATEAEFQDGQPARDVIKQIVDAQSPAVLTWAPGKWFFERGRVVRDIIEEIVPGNLLIGDTSLRPIGWPEPALMKRAAERGLKIVAGSDPLPFVSEERRVGMYGILCDAAFNPQTPVTSTKAMLLDPRIAVVRKGRRSGLVETITRLKKHRDNEKRASQA